MNISLIGARYKLLTPLLGNDVGAVGYVFNQYQDFDYPNEIAVQIIFPNGEYDGFSVDEQKLFLEYDGYSLDYIGYEFRNVMQVTRDFRAGYWKF